MTPEVALARGIEELGLDVQLDGRTRLLAYCSLLAKWNRAYNLTAIREPIKMVSHHLLDSLSVVKHLPDGVLVDVGSGAGLPGIPIAIAQPLRSVTLNDSNAKRVAFLRQAAIELELSNVRIQPGRIEDWRPRTLFAVAISRGFSSLANFVATCRHLVARGGVLAAMKGVLRDEEMSNVPPGVDCESAIPLRVPFVDAARHLVLCHVRE